MFAHCILSCNSHVIVCLRLLHVANVVQDEVAADPEFSLMTPLRWVVIRHATTQHHSEAGDSWRIVEVIRPGHVGETDYGRFGDENGDGWWVHFPPESPVEKFF